MALGVHDKVFPGQHKGEKVLLIRREALAVFLKNEFLSFLLTLFVSVIIFLLGGYFVSEIVGITLALVYIFTMVWYYVHEYQSTYFMITSRRIIKQATSGFFLSHRKELPMGHFAHIKTKTESIFEKIFGCGHISINGALGNAHLGDDNIIYFRGLKDHEEIAQYITRISNYITTNGPTDDLSSFKTRKQRDK